MAFSAQDVKELRELTGVGMMDCKKALTESDGDMQKAIDWLREKGLAAAQKKAGRIAAEGMAYSAVIDSIGVVVEVNAETDFVAQNEKFVDFVKGVAEAVAKNAPADLEALLASKYPGSDKTVQEMQQEMVLVIGENITTRRFIRYTEGVCVPYVHAGGKIGVMVNMDVSGIADMDAVTALGKDIAMQIAAMNPSYRDKSDVDQTVLDKEKEILMIQAKEDPKNASKPENIIEKMVLGRVGKFYEENCLLQQAFVKGDKITVEQHVAQTAKALGGTITVKAFTRFEKGEGIEKKQENFADEISKLVQ
ncbi:translation elongation factor Ts [Oscillospiraceae bacterium WX1]